MNNLVLLCEQLGIQYPIIQAGMAGDGITTPELVAAVSNAGGLGTLGAAYMKPEAMRKAIQAVRRLTKKPFAVNVFCAEMASEAAVTNEVTAVLQPIRQQLGLPPGKETIKTEALFAGQFKVLMEENVPVISTAFGILPEKAMQELKKAGRKVTAMVTTVEEALEAEKAGADIIVAQGSEAGGHRSTFDLGKHPSGAAVGLFSLLPSVTSNVTVPVVAAGGIADGRGLAAALMLGASGVQIGTAFLTAVESGAHPAYQKALLESNETSTVLTRAFSGRPARGIQNTFIEKFAKSGAEPLPFPAQNAATSDIRRAAAQQNNPSYMSLWAGQSTRLLESGERAGEMVRRIAEEAEKLLGRFI